MCTTSRKDDEVGTGFVFLGTFRRVEISPASNTA
jgi:hypothetical protein